MGPPTLAARLPTGSPGVPTGPSRPWSPWGPASPWQEQAGECGGLGRAATRVAWDKAKVRGPAGVQSLAGQLPLWPGPCLPSHAGPHFAVSGHVHGPQDGWFRWRPPRPQPHPESRGTASATAAQGSGAGPMWPFPPLGPCPDLGGDWKGVEAMLPLLGPSPQPHAGA